jgi:hypothetical protein
MEWNQLGDAEKRRRDKATLSQHDERGPATTVPTNSDGTEQLHCERRAPCANDCTPHCCALDRAVRTVLRCLGETMELVADVSIGEEPTFSQVMLADGTETEW